MSPSHSSKKWEAGGLCRRLRCETTPILTRTQLLQTASLNVPGGRWESMWAQGLEPGQFFDAKRSSPSLIKVLDARGTCATTPVRPKALVPGCGRGYDVVEMARRGYDVLGCFAPSSTKFCTSGDSMVSRRMFVDVCLLFSDGGAPFHPIQGSTFLQPLSWLQRSTGTRICRKVGRGSALAFCCGASLPHAA